MNDRNVKRSLVIHACIVTGSAFVLNYFWEIMQCPWFFIHRGGNGGQIAMVVAALGDVVLTWMAQSLVAAVSGRWLWLLGPGVGGSGSHCLGPRSR